MTTDQRPGRKEHQPATTTRRPFILRPAPLIVFFMLLLGCGDQPAPLPPTAVPTTPPPVSLTVGLTGSATAVADLVTAVYPADATVIIRYVTGNNATLFADLDSGHLDALLVHHIPAGDNRWFNPVALDGLALIVHPDNPVSGLTRGEAQAVFNGRLHNWSAIGGAHEPINLISRERGSGARAIFGQRIMAEQRLAITALIQPDQAAVMVAVAADPAAVGYAMMGGLDDSVKALTLDGVAATPTSSAEQSYPLTVPLYFVSPAEPQGELRAFLAWLQSDDGQAIIGGKYGRVR